MAIVIAFIIVVGAYVGYHASQVPDTGEAHNIEIEPQIHSYELQINEIKKEPIVTSS